jgi:hypothetical protein
MSEPVLLPAESIAVTVARAQLRRGENPEINMTDVLLMTVDRLRFQIEDFRAAVAAALALHQPLNDGPFSLIDYEYCSCRANEVHTDDDGSRSIGPAKYPCATVRALAPVADPDPHTTSDEEQP